MLRGHRRHARRSTTGTSRASCCTCARSRRPAPPDDAGRRRGRGAVPVRRALPARPAGAAGAAAAPARCCSSTRSTGPTTSSRRSCSRCSSTYAVTIPELGTVRAADPAGRRAHLQPHPRGARRAQAALPLPLGRPPRPRARGRDPAHPAARRCPSGWPRRSSTRRCAAAARRRGDLLKPPGVAETLDWARALHRARRAASSTSRPRPRTLGARAEVPRGRRPRARLARPAAGRASRALPVASADVQRASADPGARAAGDHAARRSPGPLRAAGVPVTQDRDPGLPAPPSPRSALDAPDAAVYWAGRATLCADPDDLAALRPGVRGVVPAARLPRLAAPGPRRPAGATPGLLAGAAAARRRAARRAATWSGRAASDDRGAAPPRRRRADRRRARRACARCSRCSGPRPPLRRVAPGAALHRGGSVDARAHPARGAAPRRRARPARAAGAAGRRPRRVVLLIDVSGSMSPTPTRCCGSRTSAVRGAPRRHGGVHRRHPADPGHPRAAAARPRAAR